MAVKNNPSRSISFPSRSHPSTHAIEEVLDKLMALEMLSSSKSGSICACLSGLEELYICTDDVLNMASTLHVLSEQKNQKFLEELLDVSVRLMDLCSASRDLMLETNENVRGVLSSVRRKKGDSTVVASYVSFRKNMRKELRKLLASLKSCTDSRIEPVSSSQVRDEDHQLTAVVRVMKQVVSVTVSIFQSFLEFSSGQNITRGSKWSLVMKLLQKEEAGSQEKTKKKQENEFEIVDSAISVDCSENLQKKLEVLERTIGGFEMSLEGLFRRLIRMRASLLNIVSR